MRLKSPLWDLPTPSWVFFIVLPSSLSLFVACVLENRRSEGEQYSAAPGGTCRSISGTLVSSMQLRHLRPGWRYPGCIDANTQIRRLTPPRRSVSALRGTRAWLRLRARTAFPRVLVPGKLKEKAARVGGASDLSIAYLGPRMSAKLSNRRSSVMAQGLEAVKTTMSVCCF